MLKINLITILLFTICSCASTNKYVYFNDLSKEDSLNTTTNLRPLTIQSGDILQVTVSTIDKEISQILNPNSNIAGGNINNPIPQGNLVDQEGNIELPLIGKIYVRGKSTTEINELIKEELNKTVKNVFVSTRLVNFRISILGDVARPGSFNIPSERVSILDALSMAGDLNISAVRDDIMIIREIEGRKKYAWVNLNNKDVLSSPYFYLANNDVIYVKPGTTRVFGNSRGFQLFPYVSSVISLLLVFYSTLIRN